MDNSSSDRPAASSRVTRQMVEGITQRIVEHFHPEKIILFGSCAQGRARIGSDIDLLVIMDSDLTQARRISDVALIAHPRTVSMDLLVYTPQEVARRLAIGDFFIQEIIEKGRVLYDAATSR